jgi:hypothetical protein
MLQETGYGVRHVQANVDPPLSGVLNAGVPEDKVLRFDRVRIDGVTPRELTEFCALQFFIKATPVNLELVGYGVPATSAAAETEREPPTDADAAVLVARPSRIGSRGPSGAPSSPALPSGPERVRGPGVVNRPAADVERCVRADVVPTGCPAP